MNKKLRATIVALAIAIISASALAQGGQRGRGDGPPGQGGPGMMRGAQAGPVILLRQDVQEELKLTTSQVSKIREILPNEPGGPGGVARGGQQGQRGQSGPPAGRRGPGGPDAEEMKKIDTAIKGVLNETQYKRYHELDLQLAGAMAVLRPDVSEKLKLTDQQRDKIMEALQPQGGPGQGQFGRGGQQGLRGQGGLDREQMEQRRNEREAAVLSVLTSQQRQQWTAMLGKKFEFERQGPPPVQ